MEVFNRVGYGSTNLLDLANEVGISRGNMAYHFKDKELIFFALTEQLWDKMKREKRSTQLPSFANLHHDVQSYYRLQKEYSFIFQDKHMLQHKFVAERMKSLCEQTLREIEMAIAFSIQLGNMKKEPVPGVYKNLALSSWMLMFYWSSQQDLRNVKKNEDGEKVIWSLLYPHLTEKGIKAFQNYFGEDYLTNLGEKFDNNIDSYVTF